MGTGFTAEDYVRGIERQDRAVLGRALTLVESTHPSHQALAEEVLQALFPKTGRAQRVGLSGAPGVGKSTLIEAWGLRLLAEGHRVAVLAVDPSSTKSGGSVLADKTRMPQLSEHKNAFIRPSPSRGELGGVTRDTQDAMIVLEAAGFDYILVETVGVGQSEAQVRNLVDVLVLLVNPGGGDELQGIKRGLLECVDVVFVNKADGALASVAQYTQRQYQAAGSGPEVLLGSALTGLGLTELEDQVQTHAGREDERQARRAGQRIHTLWTRLEDEVRVRIRTHPPLVSRLAELDPAVRDGRCTVRTAAGQLLELLGL